MILVKLKDGTWVNPEMVSAILPTVDDSGGCIIWLCGGSTDFLKIRGKSGDEVAEVLQGMLQGGSRGQSSLFDLEAELESGPGTIGGGG